MSETNFKRTDEGDSSEDLLASEAERKSDEREAQVRISEASKLLGHALAFTYSCAKEATDTALARLANTELCDD